MLRESVLIKTATTDLQGELFVGADGLPELRVACEGCNPYSKTDFHLDLDTLTYRPDTLPAAWSLRTPNTFPGLHDMPLLVAWQAIERIREEIRDAQREAEEEAQREPDCIDAHKARADAEGER